MNPYQETSDEMRRQSEGPKRFGKAALHAGATVGAASFAPLLARAAPFLSPYLSEEAAIKGLTKISPKIGNFVSKAMGAGKSFNEVRDFIGEQVEESKVDDEPEHPIKQIAPKLHEFLKEETNKGTKPSRALDLAKKKGHLNDIEKVSRKLGKRLFEVINGLYGMSNSAPEKSNEEIATELEQGYQNKQPQAPGQGQQALMAILQKIHQARGGQ